MPPQRCDEVPWRRGCQRSGVDKEWVAPFLGQLTGAGFAVVSFDLWQHRQRGSETAEQIREWVSGACRRHSDPASACPDEHTSCPVTVPATRPSQDACGQRDRCHQRPGLAPAGRELADCERFRAELAAARAR